MINSEEALNRIQAGDIPSNWHIFFAKKDFFLDQAFLGLFLIIALVAFFIWHTLNPHIVITSGFLLQLLPKSLSSFITDHFSELLHLNDKGLWRLIDYGAGILLGGFFLLVCIDGFINARKPHTQFLLLLPDGIILKKEEKATTTIAYNTLSDLFISKSKDDEVQLTLVNSSAGEEQDFTLDKRFGSPRKLARDIIRAYRAYANRAWPEDGADLWTDQR